LNILLIGGAGSIGRRYHKILNQLEHHVIVLDPATGDEHYQASVDLAMSGNYDKAIICTPTDTHCKVFWKHIGWQKPMLIEKPVDKRPEQIRLLKERAYSLGVDVRMVCNYKYALKGAKPIEWNYFKTGQDGLYWDLIQLIYINPDICIKQDGFIWQVKTNEGAISYKDVEMSYYDMIMDFLYKPERLWDMNDAFRATQAVLRRIDEQDNNAGREGSSKESGYIDTGTPRV